MIAEPTGGESARTAPGGDGADDSAPVPYVTMRVTRVLGGGVSASEIQVISPGVDHRTGRQVLVSGGPYLLFLAPAMYAADDPAGGYVVTGGPAGLYAAIERGRFGRVDSSSPKLPSTLSGSTTDLPEITKSEKQVLAEGPR
ncbi:hypothetical protein [Propionicicella superfundia]|uniref:hypothetical protein n=1 Tax=Propionicicella superfundia TaxID=348582 RepID=UPI00048CF630|nr:hypothetical protein [Propionicicella superfundia]